jgi:hypothetical protein
MPTFVTKTDISPGSTGSWQDADVSALVASGATGVIVRVINASAIASAAVGWRKNGSTDNRTNNLYLASQTQICVGVDGSRILELYRGSSDISYILEGYFGSEAVFFTNAVAKTVSSSYSWSSTSIAGDTGGDTAIAAFLEFTGTVAGARKTGSTDDRAATVSAHLGAVVGCNGSESFDAQTDGTGFHVLGYLTTGGTFDTNGTSRVTGTTGSYVDVTAFASGASALYEFYTGATDTNVALRKNGDSDDYYRQPGGGRWGRFIVEGDGSRVVEQKIGDVAADLYELGVFDAPAVVPTAPTGVTSGSVTAYSATASWTDASSDETGFKVQYAPSPYTSWTTLAGSPTAANATSLATGNVLTPGTSYKFRVASTNGNGDSAYVESGVFTTTALTFLRPIADTANGAWTASTGSDRYALIDESSTDDADYITVASASTYKTRLTSVSDPGVNTDHSVVVRAKGDGSSQLTIALVQGDPTETAIASTTVTPTASYANYTLTVTSGEAANITDYSLLYLKLTSL